MRAVSLLIAACLCMLALTTVVAQSNLSQCKREGCLLQLLLLFRSAAHQVSSLCVSLRFRVLSVSYPTNIALEDPVSLDPLQDVPILGTLDAGGDYVDVNFRIHAQNPDGSAQPFHQVLSCGDDEATTGLWVNQSYFLIPDEIDSPPPDCVEFGLGQRLIHS